MAVQDVQDVKHVDDKVASSDHPRQEDEGYSFSPPTGDSGIDEVYSDVEQKAIIRRM